MRISFSVPIIEFFSSAIMTSLRSMITKLVEKDETGINFKITVLFIDGLLAEWLSNCPTFYRSQFTLKINHVTKYYSFTVRITPIRFKLMKLHLRNFVLLYNCNNSENTAGREGKVGT